MHWDVGPVQSWMCEHKVPQSNLCIPSRVAVCPPWPQLKMGAEMLLTHGSWDGGGVMYVCDLNTSLES